MRTKLENRTVSRIIPRPPKTFIPLVTGGIYVNIN